jgi:putative SOS response-associated peptidase YedK
MCGRFGLEYGDDFYPRFKIKNLLPGIKSNFNISPGQDVPVITLEPEGNTIGLMRWGFVPSWADDPKIGYKMFNARIETIQEKPTFRSSFISRRCLVPASYFYEWKEEDGKKIPHCINVLNEKYFSMAGIFSHWTDKKTNIVLNTFSILTSSPNDDLSKIHDRMPVILKPEAESTWLEKGSEPYEFLDITKDTLDIRFDISRLENDFIFGQENSPSKVH